MSTPKILVAYGSRNGSTAGIAEMIAAAFEKRGLEAEVRPAGQVRDAGAYRAVVLGGALYNARWHPAARAFARRHAGKLAGTPVWLFSSGPLDDSADTKEIPAVRHAADAMRKLAAREHVTFGGCLTSEAKGFIARSIVRNGRGGDFRNPERVEVWAAKIAGELA
ncbi:flavodoxin domain-containing protein [Nonomuraea harbinensis]|uniref:Flavodoxin domain-containing protein n=1 Tax=Nonomuraea harbinensis TaxID=1286938 RepID=A0ABW1C902_9ACTN|nr:flavodoxin domain-containing protein [Nonomuraea harbinensis]